MTQSPPRHLPPGPSRAVQPAPKPAAAQPAQQPPQAPAQQTKPKAPPAYLSSQAPATQVAPAPTPASDANAAPTMRDPLFFHHTVVSVSAALLVPQGVTEKSDEAKALETAEAVASFLDSGTLPRGFMTQENRAAFVQSLYYQHLDEKGERLKYPGVNEGEFQQRNEQLRLQEKMAKDHPELEKVRHHKQVELDNQETLEGLNDLSEPVRAEALHATVLRLTKTKSVTGYHKEDVLSIAVCELLRSIRLAQKYGVPIHGFDTVAAQKESGALSEDVAKRSVPYPASIATEASTAMLQVVVDEIDDLRRRISGEIDENPTEQGEDAPSDG